MLTHKLPPNSLYPYFGEESDPEQILIRLDHRLRSRDIGEQCEALIFFSKLLLKYPWPIIVSTSALKLADLFVTSNNFVRYFVFRIFKQCEAQLSKIDNNLDEVLRKIHGVLKSNDPIARALTLRTLCSVPNLIIDRLNIHHDIKNCFLNTSHNLELQATLFAIEKISALSLPFAKSIINDLTTIL
eukprot:TRINITY_DN7340_c0_g1_i1.p1 TRINITY_DN7340_c0_g1~~TRINITY_DN7340_c0_g1_i1.p1  ORF type:complete len:186 (+),score=19.30 TRINITY_DN7340_c0_g1_i1:51-608(+)